MPKELKKVTKPKKSKGLSVPKSGDRVHTIDEQFSIIKRERAAKVLSSSKRKNIFSRDAAKTTARMLENDAKKHDKLSAKEKSKRALKAKKASSNVGTKPTKKKKSKSK